MEKYYEILGKCLLFSGIKASDYRSLIKSMGGKIIHVSGDDAIFLEGDPVKYLGILLSGSAQVIREDYYGNRSVLALLAPGELFAEVFSCAGLDKMPVSVIASKGSVILLLDCVKALQIEAITRNLLREMAQKTLGLNRKIKYMFQKTTKEKLMLFLCDQSKQHGSYEFVIPYNRQELADYLGVERSAMSTEISKLKKAGMIDTKGSMFRLLSV